MHDATTYSSVYANSISHTQITNLTAEVKYFLTNYVRNRIEIYDTLNATTRMIWRDLCQRHVAAVNWTTLSAV